MTTPHWSRCSQRPALKWTFGRDGGFRDRRSQVSVGHRHLGTAVSLSPETRLHRPERRDTFNVRPEDPLGGSRLESSRREWELPRWTSMNARNDTTGMRSYCRREEFRAGYLRQEPVARRGRPPHRCRHHEAWSGRCRGHKRVGSGHRTFGGRGYLPPDRQACTVRTAVFSSYSEDVTAFHADTIGVAYDA